MIMNYYERLLNKGKDNVTVSQGSNNQYNL